MDQLLLMEGYLNVPEMEVRDVRKLDKGIRNIMYLIRMVAQRTDGIGLKLLKFHSLLHIYDNIALYGVPLECDTSANESHHKPTKQAAKLTQMSHATFNTQTATRLIDFEIVDFARCEMEGKKVPWLYYKDLKEEDEEVCANISEEKEGEMEDAISVEEPKTDPKDAMIEVYLNDETNVVEFKMVSRSKHKAATYISPQLLEFLWDLQELLRPELGDKYLRVYTRIVRGGWSFRGHPNYRGKGPWRDWAWIDYGKEYGTIPCQIHCFVDIPSLEGGKRRDFGGTRLQEGVFAVVESGKLISEDDDAWGLDIVTPLEKDVGLDSEGEVLLDEEGNVQRSFFLADTNAITGPCCVIPDVEGPKNSYFLITSREEWPDLFVAWLHEIKGQGLDGDSEDEDDDSEEEDHDSEVDDDDDSEEEVENDEEMSESD